MKKDDFDFVSARDLRIGLFVDLELGWMSHPFASSRFKISSEQQIAILTELGPQRFRYIPAKSDMPRAPAAGAMAWAGENQVSAGFAAGIPQQAQQLHQQPKADSTTQQQRLAAYERRFTELSQQYRHTLELLHSQPTQAAQACNDLVQGLAAEMQKQGDTAIRLLTEIAGDKLAMHPVNVMVLSLLLGRALHVPSAALQDLGVAAFLHDMGKAELPERLRSPDQQFSTAERNAYRSHVAHGVRMGQTMGLSRGAIQLIARHHELADGSGFPSLLKREAFNQGASILALVNRYDGLCNPLRPGAAMTPHEALAMIFSQQKNRFDASVLGAFIRMMGVYPPGSVVQLNDERHALVVSVNSARPLRPRVIVHEPGTPRHQALILDLEHLPQAGIRRSLKPDSLPAAALEYLRPRQRMCYFFEPAGDAGMGTESP